MQIAELKTMSLQDKIYLLEQVWDSIKSEENSLSSPSWHSDILKKRRELYKKDKIESFSTKDIRDMLE